MAAVTVGIGESPPFQPHHHHYHPHGQHNNYHSHQTATASTTTAAAAAAVRPTTSSSSEERTPASSSSSSSSSAPDKTEDERSMAETSSQQPSAQLLPAQHVRQATQLRSKTVGSSKERTALIHGGIPRETAVATHAALCGLSLEEEKRLRALYERLDVDNDGTIDIRDLTQALKRDTPHIPSTIVPKIISRMGSSPSSLSSQNGGRVDFADFVSYVVEHEKNLESVFEALDQNRDGVIDVREIQQYCQQLGLPLSEERVHSIVRQMHSTGQLGQIGLAEFQRYMLFYPSTEPSEILHFWRHNLVIDIGEDSQLPEDFSRTELDSGIWWRHLVAGGVAGCMSRTATAPLDRLKVFLQVHGGSGAKRLSLWKALQMLHTEGGTKGFWRGNGINVVKIAPESAIKFMAYEQMKRLIQRVRGSSELSIQERFLAGSTAGVISQSVIYPMEVLKTRLALRRSGQLHKGLGAFIGNMVEKEGMRFFYKGYVPNLIGIIPYAGIDLAVYETLKSLYVKSHPTETEPGVLAVLACGTCSSTCGQLASYPLALVRTRLQARVDASQPDTMSGQFRHILTTEGPLGLYRGIAPNFMKVIPAVSISYVVYETVRTRLGAKMT